MDKGEELVKLVYEYNRVSQIIKYMKSEKVLKLSIITTSGNYNGYLDVEVPNEILNKVNEVVLNKINDLKENIKLLSTEL